MKLKYRSLYISALAAFAFTASPAIYASAASLNTPVHALFSKVKNVQISFRNDSGTPLELKMGETITKVDMGKTVNLHLAAGTRVLTNTATPKLEAGALITEVAPYLEGATISIK